MRSMHLKMKYFHHMFDRVHAYISAEFCFPKKDFRGFDMWDSGKDVSCEVRTAMLNLIQDYREYANIPHGSALTKACVCVLIVMY